jgi:prepilin signal peptidase PulO-like enzyme (type II secretory pathway)
MERVVILVLSAIMGIMSVPLVNVLVVRRQGNRLSRLQRIALILTPVLCSIFIPADLLSAAGSLSILFLLLCLSATDLKIRRIPNTLLIALLALKMITLLAGLSDTTIWQSLIGLGAGLILFSLPALLHIGIGEGDIKLAAVLGFCGGLYGLAIAAMAMSFGLLLCGLSLIALKRGGFLTAVPMGPFLSAGFFITLTPLLKGWVL